MEDAQQKVDDGHIDGFLQNYLLTVLDLSGVPSTFEEPGLGRCLGQCHEKNPT